jgi:hypothetical protein
VAGLKRAQQRPHAEKTVGPAGGLFPYLDGFIRLS